MEADKIRAAILAMIQNIGDVRTLRCIYRYVRYLYIDKKEG